MRFRRLLLVMSHRLINLVLAVLMLMPAGICTCDGGAVTCPDHPVTTSLHSDYGDRTVGECAHSTPAFHSGDSSLAHRCPAPRPHQPSCGVVAPETRTSTLVSHPSVPHHDLVAATALAWLPPHVARTPLQSANPVRSAPPFYLTDCVLLI